MLELRFSRRKDEEMRPEIRVVVEGRRLCGERKLGGLYFRSDGGVGSCGRLPIALERCPCCGNGIKLSRVPQWVDADTLLRPYAEMECPTPDSCSTCPINRAIMGGLGRSLLVTVGEKYYPTPQEFVEESLRMGLSRRITGNQVPRGFEIGKTWVLLAHRKAIHTIPEIGKEVNYTPGIFGMFRPDRIEVVVSGEEADSVIDGYLKRGLTPVKIVKAEETQTGLFDEA